nr:hypothetical protein [Tanacetum cinerariifolium]
MSKVKIRPLCNSQCLRGGCHGVAVVCRWPRWRGGDDGSGGARLEMEGVVAARHEEWGGGSCRSRDGEGFWGSPETLAGKVFRRRWPENICNNDKSLSEIKLEHGKEDELVVVVVKVVHEYCRIVVKEIKDGILEEIKKFTWWFKQNIGGEIEDDREKKLVMVNEEEWMS